MNNKALGVDKNSSHSYIGQIETPRYFYVIVCVLCDYVMKFLPGGRSLVILSLRQFENAVLLKTVELIVFISMSNCPIFKC